MEQQFQNALGLLGWTNTGWPDYSHPLQGCFQTQRQKEFITGRRYRQ